MSTEWRASSETKEEFEVRDRSFVNHKESPAVLPRPLGPISMI